MSIETVTGEDRETDPEQIAVYERLANRQWSVALTGDQVRAEMIAIGRRWAELAR